MRILFTERRTSPAKLRELIRSEAGQLGLEVNFREPDVMEKSAARLRYLGPIGGGPQNTILPELIDVVVVGAMLGGAAAVSGAGKKAGEDVYGLLRSAIVKAVEDKKMAKAEMLDDDDSAGYL